MNNKKIIISLVILGVIASLGFIAWRSTTTTTPIRVAKYYWPGEFWVEIADSKGWFKEAGLNVELVDANPDYFKSLQDTVDGKIDTNEFVLFDFVKYLGQGADLVVVLAGDRSLGADGIVAKKGITSVNDLRGKRVGVPNGTYLHFILDTLLEREGIHHSEVTDVNIQAEQAAYR